ncbi:hypothetical protein C1Y47_26115 [Priestia megaterium]|nr:hypothetical protein C1Y47_26115 [Priestia megaterium]
MHKPSLNWPFLVHFVPELKLDFMYLLPKLSQDLPHFCSRKFSTSLFTLVSFFLTILKIFIFFFFFYFFSFFFYFFFFFF